MALSARNIYDAIRGLVIINRLPLDRALIGRIKASLLKVFLFRLYDAKGRRAAIAGYDVTFLNFPLVSYLFNEVFINNEYYFIAENEKPLILDCGSNIGMSVLYFKALYPESTVVAFEPGDHTFRCLKENVQRNDLKSVTLHNLALSGKEGTIDFFYDPDDASLGSLLMSTKPERMSKERKSVQAAVLSRFITGEIDFLKMDIEGAEMEVIEELYRSNTLRMVKQMLIEYHHHIALESDEFSKLLKILEDSGFGYQVQSYLPRPLRRGQFQDVLVYAYRKNSTASKVG